MVAFKVPPLPAVVLRADQEVPPLVLYSQPVTVAALGAPGVIVLGDPVAGRSCHGGRVGQAGDCSQIDLPGCGAAGVGSVRGHRGCARGHIVGPASTAGTMSRWSPRARRWLVKRGPASAAEVSSSAGSGGRRTNSRATDHADPGIACGGIRCAEVWATETDSRDGCAATSLRA